MSRTLVAFAAFGTLLTLNGCDALGHSCTAIGFHSGALLTLHLPPEQTVAKPETVEACREPDCRTAAVPAVLEDGLVAPLDFNDPDIAATLTLGTGGVRILRIDWTVNDINPADPTNYYMVHVTDANDQLTGLLSNSVQYLRRMPAGEGCGESWWATLSD